jgi:hypothetical protein
MCPQKEAEKKHNVNEKERGKQIIKRSEEKHKRKKLRDERDIKSYLKSY